MAENSKLLVHHCKCRTEPSLNSNHLDYYTVPGGSSAMGPVRVVYQPPPWVQMTTAVPPSQVDKGPEEWTVPPQVNLGNVPTCDVASSTT